MFLNRLHIQKCEIIQINVIRQLNQEINSLSMIFTFKLINLMKVGGRVLAGARKEFFLRTMLKSVE